MPGLLSAIPGLSNLPNPLNIFNNDDAQLQHSSQSPSSPTTATSSNRQLPSSSSTNSMAANAAQPSTPNEGGGSKFVSMITKGLDVFTLNSNPTTPQKSTTAATENEDGSPTPMRPALRTDPDGSGSSGSSPSRPSKGGVVIADSAADGDGPRSNFEGNRRRGLSSASRGSGGVVAPTSRRHRRVETYVLVKPPPTSSKNPLNLQLQLVMPAKSGRPRGGSDAATKAMIPPLPTSAAATTSTAPAAAIEDSSVPSTPARQSFETPPTVEKVASGGSDATTSTPAGSVTSDAPLSEATVGAPSLATLPEDQAATKLRRRSSTGSQTSTSNASMVSSASGKQRIVPLYNLAVHNVVQPTIVTDAGTDSKVAKFLKRNLDINGVGILEPAEVWLPLQGGGGSVAGNSPRPSFDPNGGTRLARPASMISNMSLLSPAVTREDTKRSSTDVAGKAGKLDAHGLRVHDEGPKKFFGKIFRKRQAATEPQESQRRGSISTSRSSAFLAPEAGGLKVPATPPQGPAVHFNGAAELAQVGHPTFGLSPSMMARNSSATNLDLNGAIVGLTNDVPKPEGLESDPMNIVRSGRPVGYTWTVRRWAKKNTEGWASHIVAAAAAGLDMVANAIPGDGGDEVVFEWVKMRFTTTSDEAIASLRRHPAAADGSDLLKRSRPTPTPGASPAGSRVSLVSGQQSHLDAPGTIKARKGAPPSPAPSSKRRASPPTARSSDDTASADVSVNLDVDEHGVVPAVHEPDNSPSTPEEDGYDSDPEDSETPWACSVWVKRTGQRQLLATLTPAPHHPKVIAMLRIPLVIKGLSLTDFPAPEGKSEHADIAARVREEVCLTEENLKDVVSVTAMWLVAREEFSGFGRKEKQRRA